MVRKKKNAATHELPEKTTASGQPWTLISEKLDRIPLNEILRYVDERRRRAFLQQIENIELAAEEVTTRLVSVWRDGRAFRISFTIPSLVPADEDELKELWLTGKRILAGSGISVYEPDDVQRKNVRDHASQARLDFYIDPMESASPELLEQAERIKQAALEMGASADQEACRRWVHDALLRLGDKNLHVQATVEDPADACFLLASPLSESHICGGVEKSLSAAVVALREETARTQASAARVSPSR
jgi:hypothetical protein